MTGYKKQKGHHNVYNNKMQPQLPCDQEKSVVAQWSFMILVTDYK